MTLRDLLACRRRTNEQDELVRVLDALRVELAAARADEAAARRTARRRTWCMYLVTTAIALAPYVDDVRSFIGQHVA